MTRFKIPKRITEATKKPIEQEAMFLETEYMKLLSKKEELSDFEEFLSNYLHRRCNKLWKKIARRA